MEPKMEAIAQIAAAAAANAMPALRLAVADGLEQELTQAEIQAILNIAYEIQKQPAQHTQQLARQLLREPKGQRPAHPANCDCGCHDHH